MKFGYVKTPEDIDFYLPDDHPDNAKTFSSKQPGPFNIYVGCAKWNKTDLKGFYPRGTKDELGYYSSQFNCVELNATFYNKFSSEQISRWAGKTPKQFRFCPKMHQMVSHLKRLNNVDDMVQEFCDHMSAFEDRLGMVFLQMHDNFKFKDFDRLTRFIENFPEGIPLAVELRNTEYFNNETYAHELYELLESNRVSNIITDTAGRRDLLHMRLTSPQVFVRYVGANHETDYARLDEWVERIKAWHEMGVKDVYFFVHQNLEKESPWLAAYFIRKLNREMGLDLHVPVMKNAQGDLFNAQVAE